MTFPLRAGPRRLLNRLPFHPGPCPASTSESHRHRWDDAVFDGDAAAAARTPACLGAPAYVVACRHCGLLHIAIEEWDDRPGYAGHVRRERYPTRRAWLAYLSEASRA